MSAAVNLARRAMASQHDMLRANVASLTLDEALFTAGGHRSILGVLKHLGGWLHVYRDYAFDKEPRHFEHTSWPRGLGDTIEPTSEYLAEVLAWIDEGFAAWDTAIAACDEAGLRTPRPVHWDADMPLDEIVLIMVGHAAYHTGELNMLLSIARGEAWELGEEVEENHVDTFGRGVRGPWMSDDVYSHYVDVRRRRRDEIRRSGG